MSSLKQQKIEELEAKRERLLCDLFRFEDAAGQAKIELQQAQSSVSYVKSQLIELDGLLAALKE